MYTLGINAAFHDSSACIIKDGQLIAAAEEERFTQIKHGKRPIPFSTYELPFHAIDYCLKMADIDLKDVDHVAYSFDPYLLLGDEKGKAKIEIPLEPGMESGPSKWTSPWDPLFLSSIVNAPAQLIDGYPHHLQKRFKGTKATDFKWHFVDHHIAHAASAFYPSPFNKAAVLTLDGRAVGELRVAFRHKLKESLTKEAVVSFLCSPVTYPIAWKRKIERRVIVMRKWNRRTITKSA